MNRERIKEQRKCYREINKNEIAEKKRQCYADPEVKKRKAERNKYLYLQNKDKVKMRQLQRRRERKKYIDNIAMQYSCQNPNCQWHGDFDPCQFIFHHVDPKQKKIEIAKMHSRSFTAIDIEINKCCVLCRNCHPMADKGLIIITEYMMCKTRIK